MRALLCAAVLAVVPAACRGQSPQATTIRELATAWSGGQASPHCQSRGPRGEVLGGIGTRYCEWAPPPGSGALGTVTGNVARLGGPSMLTWERPTTGAADADRLIDSLGTVFARQGLALRQCGEGDVPAGRVRGMVWEGTELLVHLSRIAPAAGAPRLHVVALDDPSAFPAVICPREPQQAPTRAAAGSVMTGEGLAVLMRPDRLVDVTRYELRADSIVTVLRYRADTPASDSAAVRRTLTAALATTRGFMRQSRSGQADPVTARLVIRPCYADHCPEVRREVGAVPQPGDLVFAPAPDGSWVPAPDPPEPAGRR